jgi:hypothetical protein
MRGSRLVTDGFEFGGGKVTEIAAIRSRIIELNPDIVDKGPTVCSSVFFVIRPAWRFDFGNLAGQSNLYRAALATVETLWTGKHAHPVAHLELAGAQRGRQLVY